MANTKEKLFAEFPPVSTEQWEAVITTDLKGADYERKLVWKTGEGFNVRPYYRAENLAEVEYLGAEAGEFPYVRGVSKDNTWRVHQTIAVKCAKEANEEALKLLNSGVDSLGFCFCDSCVCDVDVDALLKEIVPTAVELTFCSSNVKNLAALAEKVLAKYADVEKDALRLNFCLDPIMRNLSEEGAFCCGNGDECFDIIAKLIKATADYKHVRVMNVAGALFSNSGSTIVEELGFTLSAAHEYLVKLMERGLAIDEVARKIRFTFAVTSNYFLEMAKFRAARMLWANIVKAYNPAKDCSCKMFAHAVTSTWNQTVYDPYVNMLRGTTEAMSAAIAGVHSLEVRPFDYSFETPTEFSKRIARNSQLLLKHESHFDQVIDPAGGSYYIESLTSSIAKEAWALFREIEEKDRVRNFQPPISGDLIMKVYGLAPCSAVGEIKAEIKDAILDGKIANDYSEAYALMEQIAERMPECVIVGLLDHSVDVVAMYAPAGAIPSDRPNTRCAKGVKRLQ